MKKDRLDELCDLVSRWVDEAVAERTAEKPANPAHMPLSSLNPGDRFRYIPGSPHWKNADDGVRTVRRHKDKKTWFLTPDSEERWYSSDALVELVSRANPEPAPEPTYLERLPEKLRPHLTEDQARMVWESRDETFAAGEPTDKLLLSECGFKHAHQSANVDVRFRDGGKTWFGFVAYNSEAVTNANALRLARRIAAIALREGGAA